MLIHVDALVMRNAIALIIAASSVLMLCGFRYQTKYSAIQLLLLGTISGLVVGATYVALPLVVGILLGPYSKESARSLIITWSVSATIGIAIISGIAGVTTLRDIGIAAPGAATYLLGVWLGSRWFQESSEKTFRNVALVTLLLLSCISLFT